MRDLDSALADHRAAVDELLLGAGAAPADWPLPTAPGKWSPSQILEHVALSLQEAANLVSGRPHRLPKAPRILRPLLRIVFHRTAKSGEFPKTKTKTTRELDPPSGPATPAEARRRLDGGVETFERASRERAASGQPVMSESFGHVSVEDYVRFAAAHARHHAKQILAARRA